MKLISASFPEIQIAKFDDFCRDFIRSLLSIFEDALGTPIESARERKLMKQKKTKLRSTKRNIPRMNKEKETPTSDNLKKLNGCIAVTYFLAKYLLKNFHWSIHAKELFMQLKCQNGASNVQSRFSSVV